MKTLFATRGTARAVEWLRSRYAELAIVLAALALRASLAATYPVAAGYDYGTHRQYIQWLVEHGSLPRFDLNVATYHPPLYYVLAALLVKLGFSDQSLAWLSIAAGAARMVLLWVAMERFLPRQRAARIVALALAAILPSALQIDGMVSNESLSAAVCWLATLEMAHLFLDGGERVPWRRACGFGAALGAALLTKVSAVAIAIALAAGIALAVAWSDRAPATMKRWRGVAASAAFSVAVVAGWFFVRNQVLYGKLVPTGYDGPAHVVVDYVKDVPYLDRRTLGYVLGWTNDIFKEPYFPTAFRPHGRFWTQLVASTFVDNLNYGFASVRPGVQATLSRLHRPLTETALAMSRISVVGGTIVALTVIGAWLVAARRAYRERSAGWLAMLAIPLAALIGQLHFAIQYPNDDYVPVKGPYMQFAALVLYPLYGMAIVWLWKRRRRRPLAVLAAAGAVLVCAYTLSCRVWRA